jgi:hypothetical protein
MRMVESIGESPFSPIAARDIAVKGIFEVENEKGLRLNWHKAHEMSGRFNEGLEWVYRHTIRIPIIEGEGV